MRGKEFDVDCELECRRMSCLRFTLLLAVYVSLDVANPMMPGALNFIAEDSVEARQGARLRAADVAVSPPAATSPRLVRIEPPPVPSRPLAPDRPPLWQAHVKRSHPSPSRSAVPSEDA